MKACVTRATSIRMLHDHRREAGRLMCQSQRRKLSGSPAGFGIHGQAGRKCPGGPQ